MSEPASDPRTNAGRQALLALAAITVVILVVMLVVLTRETTDAAGPRAPSAPSASTTTSTTTAAAPGTSTTTTSRVDKPGLAADVRNLDDADEWTTPIIGMNLQCVGPLVQDGVVIVMCNSRELKGFDARTGESLWSVKVDESPTSTFVDIPRLSGEHRVIVGDNKNIESVDAKTGEIVWSLVRDLGVTSIGTSGSHVAMVGEGKALSVDAATGVKEWEFSYPGDLFTVGGMRTDTSDRDFLVAVGTGIQATRLDDGTSHWTRTMPDGPIQDLKAFGDAVYVLTEGGALTALDPDTGRTRWERGPTEFPGHFQSVVGRDADRLYVVVSDELTALNPADGSTVWSLDSATVGSAGGLNQTHLTGDKLVMLAPNTLVVVEPATGLITVKRQMNLGAAGTIHDDGLLTVLESTGNSAAPVRLVTFNLRS